MRNLRTLKFELIAVFRNGGLTSGTELIRVKAPAAQRLGGGNALSLSMLNRARFFEGPLLSKCRVGQAYDRFSPPPSFSPSGKSAGIFSTRITENRIDRMSAYCNCWTCSPAKGQMSSSVPRWGHLMCESEERFRALVIASSDVVYRMSADWTGVLTNTGQPVRYFPRQPTSLQGQSP